MQIKDEAFPNVYACGDIADVDIPNPTGRSAYCQAMIVADNILLAARGKRPTAVYKPNLIESGIKLTLGLVRILFMINTNWKLIHVVQRKTVIYIEDGTSNLMWTQKHGDIALNAAGAWKQLRARPFIDPDA